MDYDVAVVGLGGMGSAILAHCAARGAKAIGLEQFGPAHDRGSSHGKSRLIRKAYFEDPAYVPLVLRAYELWRELERESSEDLLRITGLLTIGEEGSEIIEGTRRAAREHDLPIELLRPREVSARYPALRLLGDEVAIFEPDAGVLNPERAVNAHLRLAEARGAELCFGGAMEKWAASARGFELKISDGTRVRAKKLILALGPWFKQTLECLGVAIRVQRNVQAWFAPASDAYDAARFPCFLVNRPGLPAPLYGFPDFGDGVKAAFHGFGNVTDAQQIDREIHHPRDIRPLAEALEQWMPGAARSLQGATPCMYTLTPDEHFVIDRHPQDPDLILCGGFSGHGFKFAPVIGELCADLALDGGTRHDIKFLSLRRFALG